MEIFLVLKIYFLLNQDWIPWLIDWNILDLLQFRLMDNQFHPHRKRVKHFHQPGDFHELTFSCFRQMPLLTNHEWQQELSRCLDKACQEAGMDLIAFVYMPEHVHLLVFPEANESDIGLFLARVKQPHSALVKAELTRLKAPLLKKLTIRESPGKETFRFWQEGSGYDRNLFSPRAIQASMDYIHMNPVRRGLCQQAIDWKWSSARFYLGNPPGQQFPELPHIHGLCPEVFEEDHYR